MIVGLIGLGALGAVIAAALGTHADVRVLMRDRKAAREIASRGGIIVDDEPPVNVSLSADASVLDGCHIVIVAVKAYSTIAALEPLRGMRVSQAPFVAFQNGIDSVAHIEYALRHHGGIALAPTTMGAMRSGLGSSRRTGAGMTRVGWARGHEGDDAALVEFVRVLEKGIASEKVSPVEPHVWAKLVANAAINPLTALAGVTNGTILIHDGLRERAGRVAAEVAALAKQEGIELPFGDPVAYVEDVALITAGNRSSMLEDLDAGRPLELEAITGAVVRRAAALGVPVPENARVLDEVRARLKA